MEKTEIVTYTGKRFDINNLKISKICVKDIAHGLSYTCRYSGQCRNFYSVAEHSINCCKAARYFGYDYKLQLYALYHDASEAYLADIPTPLKKMLPEYKEKEEILQNLIYNSIGLDSISKEDKFIIKKIDDIIFNMEWYHLMDTTYFNEYYDKKIPGVIFKTRSFSKVENDFKKETNKLIDEISNKCKMRKKSLFKN